jgi:hypothetical protein
MSTAGTLTTIVSGEGVRTGATADEVADIARFAAANGSIWAANGCTALVWAITNLAGVPLNRSSNGDMTVNDNPLTPFWSSIPSFAGYSVYADTAGDGWSRIPTINALNYGNQLLAGDVLRIVAHQNSDTTGVHSMVVSRVEGSGASNIWVVDNWGGKITEHRLLEVVTYMNGHGGIEIFNVQRLDDAYISQNLPNSLSGWGEGNFEGLAGNARPDLAIQNATVDDLTVSVGQKVTVDWAVANLGSGAAGSSYAGVYLSTDASWDASDVKVGGESTSSVPGGGRDPNEDATFTVSSSISAGTWHVLVIADDGRIVVETNESNNVWSQRITVSNNATNRADLLNENVRIDDTTVEAGQSVKVSWNARNTGNAEATSTDQFIFASRDRTLSSNDVYLDRESLGRMSVGERDSEYERFAMPNLSSGRWYIGVVADAGLHVVESNESNNISWASFYIV